jgi:hypothetical protein
VVDVVACYQVGIRSAMPQLLGDPYESDCCGVCVAVVLQVRGLDRLRRLAATDAFLAGEFVVPLKPLRHGSELIDWAANLKSIFLRSQTLF